jgi:hypothetical protein
MITNLRVIAAKTNDPATVADLSPNACAALPESIVYWRHLQRAVSDSVAIRLKQGFFLPDGTYDQYNLAMAPEDHVPVNFWTARPKVERPIEAALKAFWAATGLRPGEKVAPAPEATHTSTPHAPAGKTPSPQTPQAPVAESAISEDGRTVQFDLATGLTKCCARCAVTNDKSPLTTHPVYIVRPYYALVMEVVFLLTATLTAGLVLQFYHERDARLAAAFLAFVVSVPCIVITAMVWNIGYPKSAVKIAFCRECLRAGKLQLILIATIIVVCTLGLAILPLLILATPVYCWDRTWIHRRLTRIVLPDAKSTTVRIEFPAKRSV